jgi:hypothetical protein
MDQGSVLVQWLSSRTNNNPRVIDKFNDRKSLKRGLILTRGSLT